MARGTFWGNAYWDNQRVVVKALLSYSTFFWNRLDPTFVFEATAYIEGELTDLWGYFESDCGFFGLILCPVLGLTFNQKISTLDRFFLCDTKNIGCFWVASDAIKSIRLAL